MQNFDDKLDIVLKAALHMEEHPSEALNHTVKTSLRAQREAQRETQREKTISLWWVPMLFTILTGIMVSIWTYLFTTSAEVKSIVIGLSTAMVVMTILLTIIGVRCFELKKGAIITL